MTAEEFINYWHHTKTDHDGSLAVGIGLNWHKIPLDSKVLKFSGKAAWEKMGEFYPPVWGNFKRTQLKKWLDPKRPDYDKFIEEEKSVNKIELYEKSGLIYPDFCAIADETGLVGILADGNHRYIDCNYIVMQKPDFAKEIEKCNLDILCVKNLDEVLVPDDYAIVITNKPQ